LRKTILPILPKPLIAIFAFMKLLLPMCYTL
jgi:hypothetical protein